MKLFRQVVQKDTVEINTTPEKIWDFWANIDKNYKAWHPEDHILFRWTKGKPMEEGSEIYAEETVGGKLLKGKLTCTEVIPNRKFVLKCPFPMLLFCKYEYLIEPRGARTAFTALSYLRYPGFAEKHIRSKIKIGEKHVKEEGENLKKILESRNS